MYSIVFAWHVLVQPFYNMIYEVLFPMHEAYCYLFYIVTLATCMHEMILSNAIVVVRYIFIFHLKNPTAVQDDFWNIFINVWAFLFVYACQIVFFMIPQRDTNLFYKCIGKIPVDQMYKKHGGNLPIIIMVLVSIIIHLAFYILKKVLKYYDNKKWQHLNSLKSQSFPRAMKQESILSTLALIVGLFTVATSLFVLHLADDVDPMLIDKYPYTLYGLFITNVVPGLQVLSVCFLLLGRKANLRREVFTGISSLFMK